jgi:hypothetical protein
MSAVVNFSGRFSELAVFNGHLPVCDLLEFEDSLERAVEKYRPLSPPVIKPAAIRF